MFNLIFFCILNATALTMICLFHSIVNNQLLQFMEIFGFLYDNIAVSVRDDIGDNDADRLTDSSYYQSFNF